MTTFDNISVGDQVIVRSGVTGDAITARLHEIVRSGVTVDALHAASTHLRAAMKQLTPPDAAAPQGGEVEG
jgi:hypothetical protein